MSRHLGAFVTAYVDRRLDPPTLRAFDRHLVACEVCRSHAAAERQLLDTLRADAVPMVPSTLQSTLLRLGADLAPAATPQIPQAPQPAGSSRLRTIAPAAPAQHRSTTRAVVLAAVSASFAATAAAALALTASPSATAGSTSQPPPRVVGNPVVTGSSGMRLAEAGFPALIRTVGNTVRP